MIILSYYHIIILPYYHTLILSYYNTIILPYYHILSYSVPQFKNVLKRLVWRSLANEVPRRGHASGGGEHPNKLKTTGEERGRSRELLRPIDQKEGPKLRYHKGHFGGLSFQRLGVARARNPPVPLRYDGFYWLLFLIHDINPQTNGKLRCAENIP